ncbi:phenylalanine 4-monooxygenase [Rhodocytophaga aerolata]|uniref:Phenylalanine-4-hydroxylase n=1 Tax=Rhodocytophaga aerolata TaxID=455078 RepID=A0ABT8QXX5_9BACT|nr:phenylalanine 4-monooxygenase [Rhodocytophaga aerolata]MDO1444691.1 phenylalanine 4-monooxygenase [Rhodocytophaga aerolata]
MRQHYDKYTAEDQHVWRILFERQIVNLPNAASQEYLEGIRRINFTADHIPNFEEVNKILHTYTGWQLHVVAGLLPNKEFFELMNNKRFCATTWLRKMSQLDYLQEPDMFHDVFGHVPLLTNPDLCNFLQGLSRIALKYIDNELAIELVSRLYWYTVEFGLIREQGKLRIYGAGILSSTGETNYSLESNIPKRVPYQVKEIIDTPYIKDKYQEKYFVIDSYEQLFNSVGEIERHIEQEVKNSLLLKSV